MIYILDAGASEVTADSARDLISMNDNSRLLRRRQAASNQRAQNQAGKPSLNHTIGLLPKPALARNVLIRDSLRRLLQRVLRPCACEACLLALGLEAELPTGGVNIAALLSAQGRCDFLLL